MSNARVWVFFSCLWSGGALLEVQRFGDWDALQMESCCFHRCWRQRVASWWFIYGWLKEVVFMAPSPSLKARTWRHKLLTWFTYHKLLHSWKALHKSDLYEVNLGLDDRFTYSFYLLKGKINSLWDLESPETCVSKFLCKCTPKSKTQTMQHANSNACKTNTCKTKITPCVRNMFHTPQISTKKSSKRNDKLWNQKSKWTRSRIFSRRR